MKVMARQADNFGEMEIADVRFCTNCGAALNGGQNHECGSADERSIHPEQKVGLPRWLKRSLLGIPLLFFGGFVVVHLIRMQVDESYRAETEKAVAFNKTLAVSEEKDRRAASLTSTGCKSPGAICRLQSVGYQLSSVDWVPTAGSVEAWDELRKAIKADDKRGMAMLVASGRVFLTEAGDSLRILDVSVLNNRTEARMTSGKYDGMKVVTASPWVIP